MFIEFNTYHKSEYVRSKDFTEYSAKNAVIKQEIPSTIIGTICSNNWTYIYPVVSMG